MDAGDHSASERRAGWRKSLDKSSPTKYHKDKVSKKQEQSEKKGLTDRQKRAIKLGAAVAVAALAAYGTYKLKQSGKLDPLIEKSKQTVKRLLGDDSVNNQNVSGFLDADSTVKPAAKQITKDGFKSLDRKETIREAVTKVNPSGGNTNCRACSIAAVLRMRGMDVEALGSVQGGSLREAVTDCFKDAKVTEIYSPSRERITNYILKRCGEGSSGVMSARYRMPNGMLSEHAISWAVKNGAVSFFDGQKSLVDCSKYLDLLTPDGSAEIARLDNLEIESENIKKYIKSR